jgi:hypothetical protein
MMCHCVLWTCWVGFALLLAPNLTANDPEWPQWRGPDRNGISPSSDWQVNGHPENLWEARVGLGYSSVSIQQGRLYTLGFDEQEERDLIVCLDAERGKRIWSYSYTAKIWDEAHKGGTLTTPSVDGDRVYVLNREGQLFCFQATDGRPLWSRSLREELGVDHPRWGFAASPLVLEDRLILNLGRLIALDKESGKQLWNSKNYGDAYSTPATLAVEQKHLLAAFNGDGLALLNLERGSEEAFYEWDTSYDVNAATPVITPRGVFISSGYNHGCALLEFRGDQLLPLWENKKMRNQMAGCVLFEDHLYGFDDATFKCLNLEGEEKWRQRGLGKGAHILADGKLILLTAKGELVIAAASPQGFTELSRSKVLSGGVCWTTPVLAGGKIYCRNSLGQLVCRDHRLRAGS